MLVAVVFSRQQKKLRPLLALSDLLVFWMAFEAAYFTRSQLQLKYEFYFTPAIYALLQVSALGFGAAAGWWTGALDRAMTAPACDSPLTQCARHWPPLYAWCSCSTHSGLTSAVPSSPSCSAIRPRASWPFAGCSG